MNQKMRIIDLTLGTCLAIGAGMSLLPPQGLSHGAEQASQAFDPASLKHFIEGAPYLGQYETGLYPGGTSVMPDAHRRTGQRLAAAVSQHRRVDRDGAPGILYSARISRFPCSQRGGSCLCP